MAENYTFKAEIQKLLDILSKSLYTHKEIFLRELISNSADAIKKIDFIQLKEDNVVDKDAELRIDVIADPELNTLTIKDNGVGMTKQELIDNLGTIAASGSERFMKALQSEQEQDTEKKIDLDIIGMFGVGFYSVFMIAKEVEVISKSYIPDEPAYRWVSKGIGEFTVEPAEKSDRGTEIIIHLNDDEDEYLGQYRIENIIKKYSNFIPYPIYVTVIKEEEEEEEEEVEDAEVVDEADEAKVDVESEEEKAETEEKTEVEENEVEEEKEPEKPKPVNETKPLWRRPIDEITEEDYKNFYHFISNRYDNYIDVINYRVDGRVQFRSILYIPESKSQDLLRPEIEYGPSLYSKNVMIMENCKELIPQWLRFIKGMVDSEDISLNISRETIQSNRIIIKIEQLVVKKFFREINKMMRKKPEDYNKFWKEFGVFIKEGIVSDHPRREKLMKLLRFKTSKTKGDEMIGLDKYIERMAKDQKDLFYLVGEDIDTMRLSPHLGYYDQQGIEVIFFDEPIDNFLMMNVPSHAVTEGEGEDAKTTTYMFKAIDVTEEKPEKEKEEGKEDEEDAKEEEKDADLPEDQKAFLEFVKKTLGDKITDAKMSSRLYGNAVRLANPSAGMSSSMQRAMRYWTQSQMGKDFQIPRKIFEFNPDHALVQSLINLHQQNPDSSKLKPVLHQLFENCLLSEGDLPNPATMVPRINQILEMFITGSENVENPLENLKKEEETTVDLPKEDESDIEKEEVKDDNSTDKELETDVKEETKE